MSANPNSLEYFTSAGESYPYVGATGNLGLNYFTAAGEVYGGLFASSTPTPPAQQMLVVGMIGTLGRI